MEVELTILCTCSAQLQPHVPIPDICTVGGSWAVTDAGDEVFVPVESDEEEVVIP